MISPYRYLGGKREREEQAAQEEQRAKEIKKGGKIRERNPLPNLISPAQKRKNDGQRR